MDKPRVSKIFDIPPYYYFESGNLTLKIWHGMLCSEKATIEIEQTYPNNAESFQEMIHFLEETYQKEQA